MTLDYDLHKLGWRAFQDLCAVVLQQVLGQTFTTFADSNDVGQDGAFHGAWQTPADTSDTALEPLVGPGMAVVAQCKFSTRASGTLTPSELTNELDKIQALYARGQCDGYLLLTNLEVTGRTKAWLIDEVRALGPQHVHVLPGAWICSQIERNWNLRRYVPRVYGLGDLGRILDDRRIRQARALLTGLQRELATFVPTDAYRQASDAISEHGFVLLLGEPASGKSTIAATLCMTALDHWNANVKRVDGPDELIANWDADDPSQVFWVDDAFGSIRHDPTLTDAWTRRMDQVMAAVSDGARILLTSRDYIYREAKPLLKEYAYPRLQEHKVVVDVTDLSTDEKSQILYNHLKAGDQPAAALALWRPTLPDIARLERFQPEVARRLSMRAFTPSGTLTDARSLIEFFEHPRRFLVDVLNGLTAAQKAALATVYLTGDELPAPVTPSPQVEDAIHRLGATTAEALAAFTAVRDTFLSLDHDTHGNSIWRFRHPTIREGFAAYVAEDISTMAVYIDGMTDAELVRQLDCGGPAAPGTFVHVPPALYDRIVPRVPLPVRRKDDFMTPAAAWFLIRRCSDEFLRAWAQHHDASLGPLLSFGMYLDAYWEPKLLGRLAGAAALPEHLRVRAANQVSDCALDLDSGYADPYVVEVFNAEERQTLLDRLRDELVPRLESAIDDSADGWDSTTDPEERYAPARHAVEALKAAFPTDPDVLAACEEAEHHIEFSVLRSDREYDPPAGRDSLAALLRETSDERGGRDPFEDVHDGH
ncbi:hypothetical protein [Nocardioides sp. Iso805N]|uniref:nSTAND3 domain-containing NTPase n=1 Tax=Nocardioides sp. Iso805N TaxID=1283287 RepID=UPI000382C51B|nr:hypothetical protein [Nocardioides sp. Iso805N]